LNSIKKSTGIKITDVVYENGNEVFDEIKEFVESILPVHAKMMEVEISEIMTVVEGRNNATLKVHECITLWFIDGSHLRFSPSGDDALELTRLWVKPENHGKGIGSLLMETFENIVVEIIGELPRIELECTGAVGLGDNSQSIPISKQINFFRRFGYKISSGNNSNVVKMIKSQS
jgi:GNAT superfamily N-acetyltransferase